MSVPCVSQKSIYLPSFICGCAPVSEIREFNQKKKKKKKKMNNSEKAYFKFVTFSIVKKNPFFNQS